MIEMILNWLHDILYNDTQQNDTQQNYTQHNAHN